MKIVYCQKRKALTRHKSLTCSAKRAATYIAQKIPEKLQEKKTFNNEKMIQYHNKKIKQGIINYLEKSRDFL